MRRRRLPLAGAAHGLAVHRDHSAAGDGAGTRAEPGPQAGVEACGIQVPQDPPDGGLQGRGLSRGQAPGPQVSSGQVGGVLPYRCQAATSGCHYRHAGSYTIISVQFSV